MRRGLENGEGSVSRMLLKIAEARTSSTELGLQRLSFHVTGISDLPTIWRDYYRRPGPEDQPTSELVALFSQAKINECHRDIMYPSVYTYANQMYPHEHPQLKAWHERDEVMFFRGSSTGDTKFFCFQTCQIAASQN